jgi:hypothetical protein
VISLDDFYLKKQIKATIRNEQGRLDIQNTKEADREAERILRTIRQAETISEDEINEIIQEELIKYIRKQKYKR